YVHLPRDGSKQKSVTIVFDTNSAGDYRWHVKVTQIDCKLGYKWQLLPDNSQSEYLPAPIGCLQYYTPPTSTVESFNFGQYINNVDYALCIKRQPNTCRVTYQATDNNWSLDSTQLSKDLAGVGDATCNTDYLLIPGGSGSSVPVNTPTYDRYCGGRLNWQNGVALEAPVVSKTTGPIVLWFHSDSIQDPTVSEGFRLRYEQSSAECTTGPYRDGTGSEAVKNSGVKVV
ncbi:unnamed protein product, partial [Oppiella nova]